MTRKISFHLVSTIALLLTIMSASYTYCQTNPLSWLEQGFTNPPAQAKPWVYWYWMRSAVTREGIKADIESMKEAGIGGAYLMTIRATTDPPYIVPPVVPLSPEWWDLINFTINEADKNDIELAMTPCDGWALAGGPWISPELSMQHVVWTNTVIDQGEYDGVLPQPESYKDYYQDIAVYAYPATDESPTTPSVSSSTGSNVQFLVLPKNKKNFTSKEKCWVQFDFKKPYCARSLVIRAHKNYQSMRLILKVSNDGKTFKSLGRLEAPRHGWQDGSIPITHSLGEVTARYFRLEYDPAGSEPGSEELDYAKWTPELSIQQVTFSPEPKIHQYEGKSGDVWRVSKRSTNQQLPPELCIPKDRLINITQHMSTDGHLRWTAPAGKWNILRMGYTSTGHKNAAAGAATGLECDKFSREAARIQFNGWFAKALEYNTRAQVKQIIKIFHVDSWECGSQNWSPVFADEFKKRRGYDIVDYLPVMAGVPIDSADKSERVLHDIRQTITELISDNFFGTLSELAHEQGCSFSAEATAPTMTGDGMLHFNNVDIPMGEFWFRSPTHDKPNDIWDAVSGGHIYGKNIIQAEAFTELRLMWDEHPGMFKTLGDHNFATGINRFVLHVNAHNPWTDRKPGMTLDGIGIFFQRNQTWWKPGKAWIDYLQRCQYMLQQGRPVADIAVFTGQSIPRRAVLPEKLVDALPGILGSKRVEQEQERLRNQGIPMRTVTEGYPAVANLSVADKWTDPLNGYSYDSFNPDALLNLATAKNKRVEFADGSSYGALVIPGLQSLSPDEIMSTSVAEKLLSIAKAGVPIILNQTAAQPAGLNDRADILDKVIDQLKTAGPNVHHGPYRDTTFDRLDIPQDFIATDQQRRPATDIVWTHRTGPDFDIYFAANQQDTSRILNLSLRATDGTPQLWDPLTGQTRYAEEWRREENRTILPVKFHANGSIFIVMAHGDNKKAIDKHKNWPTVTPVMSIDREWTLQFYPEFGGPAKPRDITTLYDWRESSDEAIRHYSGTASYTQPFDWHTTAATENIWLDIGTVHDIAEVYVNDVNCGVAWTPPYRVNISKALKIGPNEIRIEVTNTWANRLIGDAGLPEDQRITWTVKSPIKMKGRKLLPAGLIGPVQLLQVSP